MLALVVLCEGTIRLNRTTFTAYNALSWAFTREQVATAAVGAEILCLGDSRAKYAVLPQVIRAATGREAYNLAITAGCPPSSYFLLRDALEAGARPRAIVVDFDEKLLADEPLGLSAPPPWADLLTGREAAELEGAVGSPGFATRVALERVLHSLKNRFEIRGIVSRLVRAKGGGSRRFHEVAWRNWTVNGGAQVNAKREYHAPPTPTPPRRHVEGTWAPHPVNVLYVERFLSLARARGIPVYWLLPPRCPSVQLWREWYGEEWRYEQFAAEMLKRFPDVVIVDARHSGYEVDVFVDVVHLDRDGASTLSKDLAVALEILPTLESKPRWAQLPRYSEPPANVVLEDIEESRRALNFGGRQV
ncbi:MAG: hypothetical protein P4L84_10525, partial [Isosphaeraceae bacterium]|nr:hypothetical protein [Isosphaeraceae bacterium]